MKSKFSRIPSWAVAFAGAALVLLATAVGAIWYQTNSSERAKLALEASSLHADADQLWASHLQGDERNTAAGVFVALALSDRHSEDPRASEFSFGRAADHLHGAFISMRAASDLHAGGPVPPNVATAESDLRQGDITAYNELGEVINSSRAESAKQINDLLRRAKSAEARAGELDDTQTFIYVMQVCVNLLGLCLVMCKDLPIWASRSRKE